MISVNEEYKNVLKSDEQQYDAYIILEDGTKVDTDISGLKPIYNLGEKIIGNFATKRVEFTLFNTGKYNITNKEFEAFIGLKVNNEFKYTSIGKYIADKPVLKDEATDENTIKARDYSLKFKVAYEPILTFPCSVKKAISDICGYLNIDYIENNFINGDYILQEFYIDEEATFFDVIKILVEAGFANAFITNTNKLIVKSPSMTVNYKFDLNELFELKKEDNKFGKLNSVVASRIVADDGSTTEDVYAKDENSITTNGLYEYKIIQNDAIDYDRQTAVNNMLTGILNFEYNPAKLETVYNPALEVGDMLEVPDKKTDTSFLLFAKEICADLSNGLMTIESTEKTKTETDYKSATNKDKRRKTEIKVNKLEGEITQRIESVETTADEALDNTDILDEFIEQKEVQIEAAESSLQNVEIFGESMQESREGYNYFNTKRNVGTSTNTQVTIIDNNNIKAATTQEEKWKSTGFLIDNLEPNTDYFLKANIENSNSLITNNYCVISNYTTGTQLKAGYELETGITFNTGVLEEGQSIQIAFSVTSATAAINTAIFSNIFLVKNVDKEKEYEPYGAMPSIDYPSPISSITNIDYKATGKNIFDGEMELGSINWINGEFEDNANCIRSKNYIEVIPGQYYAFSNSRNYTHNVYNYDKNKQFINAEAVSNNTSYQIPANAKYIRFRTTQGTIENNLDTLFQIEKGSTVTSFELYKEKTTTIKLPEGAELCSLPNGVVDCVDSTGVIHKKIGKMVLDGTGTYGFFPAYMGEGYCYYYEDARFKIKNVTGIDYKHSLCTHFKNVYANYLNNTGIGTYSDHPTLPRKYFVSDKSTLEEFKMQLAELQPTLIFELAEEETTQNLAETEKEKLQNIETFEGINNITTNATLSAEYFRNIDLNKAFETKTSATNKYTEIKSTTDTIKNTVAETNSYVDNTLMSKIVATEQSIEGLKISLQQTGGQNFIKNSTLKFGLSKDVTTTGTVTVEEYTEIQNNTVSKSAIKINAGNVIYEPCDVKEGNVYTFSCLVNKLELANASITITNVLDNKIDVVAEAEKFVEIGYTFVALSSKVQIKLESDTNYTLFSDCMLSAGAERKAWQLASGEISNKGVNINDDGAEFFNSDVNTKLTISSSGTNIINTETGEVRTKFNADDTLVNNLTVEGISRHGRLIHTDFGTHITTSWSDN